MPTKLVKKSCFLILGVFLKVALKFVLYFADQKFVWSLFFFFFFLMCKEIYITRKKKGAKEAAQQYIEKRRANKK